MPAGQFLAVTGPSGSGKSTLLGLIAGLDAPSGGQVRDRRHRHHGARRGPPRPAARPEDRLRLPVLPPDAVADRLRERDGPDGDRRAGGRARPGPRRCSSEVGLTGRGHHYPSQLSGGEQQRIAIARALANDPPILLADEPTGNLDTANGRHIMDLLREVNERRGTTLVLATHDAGARRHGPRSGWRCGTGSGTAT